ncbi:hypothetical protein EOA33_19585 [Mesorhizobium sp. M4A.F.Ca.ET.050.02.1.1]|uniref:hypothetical protein n=1 Tax=Mesorhizobium sp. M4A.F.Ca.ET.050.02.1.1 TaxID=2496754 RepID=UPI000FCB69A2|nr:hypothetical protein [Mesorhizobium sp. M4A.F.Ca.ET.050.02.1.1]RUX47025.1 hypothetical protein EOA33_19585 [Mesorhizobium sp. M4A.F.Ca.ET.050.02.1.1]
MHIDHVAVVGEFLTEVDNIDIIIELVQNELDAGATRTEIEIGDDALICFGNGSAMEPKGWERLRFVLGAGALVDAKMDGIGSKNHGIRTGFLLGDNITVQSDRHRIDLTAKGQPEEPERFYPAAWPKEPDLQAPETGVRVTIPYRTRPAKMVIGNPLTAPSATTLDKLFEDAASMAPDRFLCASVPGRPWQYELVLRRRGRQARLTFRSTAPDRSGISLRTCHLSSSARAGRLVARLACSTFDFTADESDDAKVPRLYRRGSRIVCELCWPTDTSGWPYRGAGTYRYPIAFPKDQAGNGLGFDVSGPFVAGKARHSLAEDRRNVDLIKAARAAFVDLMLRHLVPTHGPAALALLENVESPRPVDVKAMVEALVDAGALPIWSTAAQSGRHQRYETSTAGLPPQLPMPRYGGGMLHEGLARLAPAKIALLHPESPASVVLAMRDIDEVRIFDEVAAARSVFVDEAPAAGEKQDGWLEKCERSLHLLELSRLSGKLEAKETSELKASGRLPTADGSAKPWSFIERAAVPPPKIPGVENPRLLHPRLAKSAILRDGAGTILRFKLDDYLARLDFNRAGAIARTTFFQWLRRNHSSLSPRSLGKIAEYPVWPDEQGVGRPLESFCWPKQQYLREALSTTLPMPAQQVVSFPGLRRASNAALRLRSTPGFEELASWHNAAMDRVRAATDAKAAAAEIDHAEKILVRLREDGIGPKNFAHGHLSVSLSGEIRPIVQLHADTAAVRSCHLAAEDLLPTARRVLHLALGANATPLPEALIKALRADPQRSRLAARLDAYKSTERPLSELSDEAIIEVDGKLLTPSSLAYEASTDMWGEWKRKIPIGELAPQEAKLLEESGVLKGVKEEYSRGFFEWLAGVQPAVLSRHRTQIVRHWLDRRAGPSRWSALQPSTPCVMAYSSENSPSLHSHREAIATKAQIYLPDMRAIQSAVLADNPRMKLAVVDARGVDGSAIQELRDRGVKSLASKIGAPTGLSIVGHSRSDERLDAELRLLRSSDVRRFLKSMLPRFDVPSEALGRQFRRFLDGIAGVRAADGLEAVYTVNRRHYQAPATAGYLAERRTFYVAADSGLTMPFYEAVAKEIFDANSPPAYTYGLYRAVHEITAPGFAQSHFEDLDIKEDDLKQSQQGKTAPTEKEASGSAEKGHGLPDDVNPFLPKPNKIEKLSGRTYTKPTQKKKSKAPASTDALRHSIEEDAQLNDLKFEHYAAHCQACIGAYDVLDAAPPQSYVHSPHYRKSIIHAHHVKLLANLAKVSKNDTDGFGARNVLILCRFHHAQLGDLLSREMVRASLRTAGRTIRNFPDSEGGTHARKGLLVRIEVAADPYEIDLYFTKEHAQAWLED